MFHVTELFSYYVDIKGVGLWTHFVIFQWWFCVSFILSSLCIVHDYSHLVEANWNVMAHAQKPDFVFRRKGRVHLNRRGRQFIRLLAAEVCASAVVMLATACSEVVWMVLATHSIRQFPLHFPSLASLYAVTFELESTNKCTYYTNIRFNHIG